MLKKTIISLQNCHITTPLKMTEKHSSMSYHTLHPSHRQIHLILQNVLTTHNANILSLHKYSEIMHFSCMPAATWPSKDDNFHSKHHFQTQPSSCGRGQGPIQLYRPTCTHIRRRLNSLLSNIYPFIPSKPQVTPPTFNHIYTHTHTHNSLLLYRSYSYS
jgi:hypothetical protein